MRSLERWDLPQPFLPVMMFSVPSMDEASMVRSEESLVPPKDYGEFAVDFCEFHEHGDGEFFDGGLGTAGKPAAAWAQHFIFQCCANFAD